ncbi:mechanosensitive ion channel family protein [Chitinophaga sp. Cy-1792]|uniref:mechanosensitive ion channel family protein n=1 Tax=Chitinophaga sp. Cy-1792 TaxID=2608339 RepID=UPI0014237B43|nr:mechanosensitive ion channel domain-containing protein [Chitinophaga sp. Cy-1792]NIG52708.1 mechanosensitive ion channel [Chitinophaga sp. Cy-1792]
MNKFLDTIILDNPVKDYLILILVLLFVSFIKRVLSKIVAALLFRLVKHWSPQIEQKSFVELLLKPLEFFFLLVTFMFVIDRFKFPEILNVHIYGKSTLKDVTDNILQLVFTASIIRILLRLVDFISLVLEKKADLTADKTDNQFVIFFRDFFKAIILIMGVIACIRIFSPDLVGKIITGLGIGAAALALAAKESIENLIGSFMIFFDKPFRVGDTVKVDAYTGTVEKIGLRSTRIRTQEKTFVTVPNKKMVDSILDNLTLRTQQRVNMKLELTADTPADAILGIVQDIRAILKGNQSVLPGFTVNLHDFTKDTVIVQVIFNTLIIDGQQYAALRETVNLAIIQMLEHRGIKLPGSSTTVVLKQA